MPRTVNTRLPFGKHKNRKISDLPTEYLEWVRENLWDGDLHEFASLAATELQNRERDGTLQLDREMGSLEQQADEFLARAGYNARGRRKRG